MPTRRLPARPDEAPSTSSRSSFPRRTNASLHSSALRLCPVEWMYMEPRRRMCATATTDCFYFLRQKNCRVDSTSSDSVNRNQTHESPFDDRYREASLLFAGRAGSGRGAADRGERAGIPTVRGRVGGDVAQVGFEGGLEARAVSRSRPQASTSHLRRIQATCEGRLRIAALEDSCASLGRSISHSISHSLDLSLGRSPETRTNGRRRPTPAPRASSLGAWWTYPVRRRRVHSCLNRPCRLCRHRCR